MKRLHTPPLLSEETLPRTRLHNCTGDWLPHATISLLQPTKQFKCTNLVCGFCCKTKTSLNSVTVFLYSAFISMSRTKIFTFLIQISREIYPNSWRPGGLFIKVSRKKYFEVWELFSEINLLCSSGFWL